ncbi:50S ribosomal protein L2 [candidate division MSBL1 archaeon SCGC-AAA259I09]|uniref:Large ribosomal subunit protein uL2 n=2 Tax=candidate division MSBL1 TaxID=215777 RepID=A0A133UQN5_9EURY|nr:50S ribosomal protein L2 [candidate division MSBL1 archaeon SCGC-AAA259D14]KXA96515.1 50S ribosomal protein L2 [candidate division MSBL1 archaeon SCGC-AAA259I09]
MGKRTRGQRLGRGSPTYKAGSGKKKSEIRLPPVSEEGVKARVVDIIHERGRSAPIAKIRYSNGEERFVLAPEGIVVDDEIECGISAPIEPGNTLPLSEIPEGTPVHNIESQPGKGGEFSRASGTNATLIAHDVGQAIVQMPSGEIRSFNPKCRATVGIVAGGGRKEKPFVKAGNKHFAKKAKGRFYPRVSGVAMNAVDHPFGSGRGRHAGRPRTVRRDAPPGQKVGLISARRTGKR